VWLVPVTVREHGAVIAFQYQQKQIRCVCAIRYSSISQTELFRLCVAGEIESVHRLKPGQAKGIRLINKKSLDAYIRSFLPGGKRYQKSIAEQKTRKMCDSSHG
jgi:hypothetical protein